MILVDSSSWIHFLRPDGDRTVRARAQDALANGEACWCPLVRLELWNGAAGDRDRKILRDFEAVLPELAIDDQVWSAAYELARRARSAGATVPATDPGSCLRTPTRRRTRNGRFGLRAADSLVDVARRTGQRPLPWSLGPPPCNEATLPCVPAGA